MVHLLSEFGVTDRCTLLDAYKECDEYEAKNNIIQSVPGVGNVVAFNLLSDMPELGYVNNKEAASLVGVAPFNRESGVYQGKRMIRGGRPKIRTAMYMAMMSAIQCNPKFKEIYQRMVAAGKPKKQPSLRVYESW